MSKKQSPNIDELTLIKCDYIMFVEKTRASCDELVNLCNKKLELAHAEIDRLKDLVKQKDCDIAFYKNNQFYDDSEN